MKLNDIKYYDNDNADIVADCVDGHYTEIGEAITMTADNNVMFSTASLLDWLANNHGNLDYCDQAINNGLVDLKGDNIITRAIQAGQAEYYYQQLQAERTAIVLLYAFKHLNTDEIDDELADEIESRADYIERFDEIDDIITEYNENKQ